MEYARGFPPPSPPNVGAEPPPHPPERNSGWGVFVLGLLVSGAVARDGQRDLVESGKWCGYVAVWL